MNINKLIAEKKGLPYRMMGKYVYSPEMNSLLDYLNDPKLILELQMELLEKGWWFRYHETLNKYLWLQSNGPSDITDDDIGTATAMAWLKEND